MIQGADFEMAVCDGRGETHDRKLFPSLVTSNRIWLQKYLPGWGQ